MRIIKSSSLFLLAGLVACSSVDKKEPVRTTHVLQQYRSIAGMNEVLSNQAMLNKKLDTMMDGIFQAYLIGHSYLQSFDKQLDKDASKAMKSDAYSSLLAVRSYVDQFEHDINDFYLGLVVASALPEYDETQKSNAEFALGRIGEFMKGIKANKQEISPNLRPLILSNLIEKQHLLYDEMKDMQNEIDDEQAKQVIHKNMVLLRATRMSYGKELATYDVDSQEFKAAVAEEKQKASYQKLQKDIKSLSKDMKKFISDIGRGTSADAIYPSAGANGNITGRSFPANTWSLTYDDGPAKTTPQVLQNLKDKNVPATFFMLAKQVEGYPNTAASIRDAGHDVACHSYTHQQLTKVGPANLEKEISTATKVIEQKLGVDVKLFRLPYGAGTSVSNIRAKIAENNLIHVFWTVDTLDWQDKNPTSVFNRAVKQMNASAKNAGIVLFHDIHTQSVTASAMLMDYFNKHGLTTCTVQGVVDQLNKNLPSCK